LPSKELNEPTESGVLHAPSTRSLYLTLAETSGVEESVPGQNIRHGFAEAIHQARQATHDIAEVADVPPRVAGVYFEYPVANTAKTYAAR